jgi:hypothetical protein
MSSVSTRLARRIALSIVLATCSAAATGASVERATPEQKRLAQKTFEAADELYEAGRFEEAMSAFRGSYEIVASPNSLLMIARSERELGHFPEAYELFERSLALAEDGAGRYAETARATREELAALRDSLGFVELDQSQLPEGTTLRLDERVLSGTALSRPIAVAPGAISLELKTPDGKSSQRAINVARGTTERVTFGADNAAGAATDPMRAAAPSSATTQVPAQPHSASAGVVRPLRSAAFIAGGVAAAGVLGFGIFGALNESTFHDLRDKCSSASCAASQQSEIDRGRRYQLLANVGLGVAIAGAATGATLYVLSLSPQRAVLASVGPGSVLITGRF